MPRTTTFEDLVTENAFGLIGTLANLLKQADRAIGGGSAISKEYTDKAFAAGSHEELVRISHEYAYQYAATTLAVDEDVEAYLRAAVGEDEEEGWDE